MKKKKLDEVLIVGLTVMAAVGGYYVILSTLTGKIVIWR